MIAMINATPRVYSYARISSAKQKAGGGIERQLSIAREWARAHSLPFDESTVLLDEGLSGFHGIHKLKGVFGKFLAAVEAGKIARGSVLVIESLDRFSRQHIRTSLPDFLSVINAGITIVADGQEFDESLEMTDLITCLVFLCRAHDESLKKSERGLAAWDVKRKNAMEGKKITNSCPGWLDVVDGEFVLNKAKSSIVKRIYKEYLAGTSITNIAKALNDEKISPWYTRRSKRNDVEYLWTHMVISNILKSETTYGEYQLGKRVNGKRVMVGEPIHNYYPAAIKKSIYEKAKAKRSKGVHKGGRTRTPTITNLLQGMLKCGECHEPITFISTSKKRKDNTMARHSYYRCKGRSLKKNCDFKPIKAKPLEDAILMALADLLSVNMDEEQTGKINEIEDNIILDESTIRESEKQLNRLIDNIADGSLKPNYRINDRIATLENAIEESSRNLKEHKQELSTLTASSNGVKKGLISIETQWIKMQSLIDAMGKKQLESLNKARRSIRADLQSIIDVIYITEDEEEFENDDCPFDELEEGGIWYEDDRLRIKQSIRYGYYKLHILLNNGFLRVISLDEDMNDVSYDEMKRITEDADLWFIDAGEKYQSEYEIRTRRSRSMPPYKEWVILLEKENKIFLDKHPQLSDKDRSSLADYYAQQNIAKRRMKESCKKQGKEYTTKPLSYSKEAVKKCLRMLNPSAKDLESNRKAMRAAKEKSNKK